MKKTFLFFLALLSFCSMVTCKRTQGNNMGVVCPALFIIRTFPIKFIDKTTGNNLVFGPNAKIQFTKIQLKASQKYSIPISDSLNQSIDIPGGSYDIPDTVSITLPGYSTDTFIVYTSSDGSPCPQMQISKVILNGQTLCAPCITYTLSYTAIVSK